MGKKLLVGLAISILITLIFPLFPHIIQKYLVPLLPDEDLRSIYGQYLDNSFVFAITVSGFYFVYETVGDLKTFVESKFQKITENVDLIKSSNELKAVEITKNYELVSTKLSTLLKEEYSSYSDHAIKNISGEFVKQFKAEKTILKILLDNCNEGKYFDEIYKLHAAINSMQKAETIPFVFDILIDGTVKLNDYFNNSIGGIISTKQAVQLYSDLLKKSQSILIIEPEYIENYDDNYTVEYQDFIKQIGGLSSLDSKLYYYLDNARDAGKPDTTKAWLEQNNFKLKICDINIDSISPGSKEWTAHSHLIFFLSENEAISCSVLPVINPKKLNAKSLSNLTNKDLFNIFKNSDDLYLSFKLHTDITKKQHPIANLVQIAINSKEKKA